MGMTPTSNARFAFPWQLACQLPFRRQRAISPASCSARACGGSALSDALRNLSTRTLTGERQACQALSLTTTQRLYAARSCCALRVGVDMVGA